MVGIDALCHGIRGHQRDRLRLVMIDDLPSFPKAGTNKTIGSAQRLKLPLAVDGQTDELACDYYQFDAKKGQRVSVEVVANIKSFGCRSTAR